MVRDKVPFIRIIIPFAMGIATGGWIEPDIGFYLWAFIILGLLLAIAILLHINITIKNVCWGIIYAFALFLIGLFLYTHEKRSLSTLDNEELIIEGIIEDYPIEKTNTYQFTIKMRSGQILTDNFDVNIKRLKGSVLIYQRKRDSVPVLKPGDIVTMRITPQPITNRGNPYEFDYKFYMETMGIKYMAFTETTDILRQESPAYMGIKYSALIVRERLLNAFVERGITEEQLPLLAALTLGYREYLDEEQEDYFSRAGIMHIMAVSGMHAGIVSMLVLYLLFFMRGRWHNVRICIAIVALWGFAFITGLTPSVVRASLMFSFLQVGRMIKRPVNGLNSVLASAFILLLLQPSVLFVSGFQLSYMAVIYIVCFYQQVHALYTPQNRLVSFVWDSASITLLAQAGTLPLTITLFNRFPVWFMLSNILILPVAIAALIAGLLVLISYPIVFLSEFIATITNYLVEFTEWLTVKAASLPLAVIDGIGMTTLECVVLLIVMALCARYVLNRKRVSPILAFVSILTMVIVSLITEYKTTHTKQLIVYNDYNFSTIGIQSGNNLTIWSDNLYIPQSVLKHKATLGLKVSISSLEKKPFILEYDNHQVLVTSVLNRDLLVDNSPDMVILQGDNIYFESDFSIPQGITTIVVTNNTSPNYYQRRMIEGFTVDSVHYVARSGAFIY